MNEKEIEKEPRQLPNEWYNAFNVRIANQALPHFLDEELRKYLLNSLCEQVGYEFKIFAMPVNYRLIAVGYAEREGIDIARELTFVKTQLNSGKIPSEYLYQPLYASQSQEWLQRGKELVQFFRNYGHGFDIWADWFQGRIDGVPTDKQFLEAVAFLPKEILAQEPAQINAYLKNLCQTERPLNRVRVIFLGYGEAGKTSLIRALNGLEVVAGKEQMTPGIDISTWQVPGTEITAHFWDFGGQVVAHATHQFFLRSRCLYILLLDGRTEINANEQAEYWLEYVRIFLPHTQKNRRGGLLRPF